MKNDTVTLTVPPRLQDNTHQKDQYHRYRVESMIKLSNLGVYTNSQIGEAFGVGYTAVTGAAKRGERYLQNDGRLKKTVEKIINDT